LPEAPLPLTDVSNTYDEDYYLSLPAESGRIAAITRLLNLQGNEIVCEIGCAAGHFLAAIAHDIGHGTGIDTADAAIRAATHLKDKHELENIDFVRISAQEYAAAPDRRDQCHYVFLMDVTEHIDDDIMLEILEASRQLLKRDGQLVIHTPNLDYWLERLKSKNIVPQLEGHIAVRNQTQYARLLEIAGFEFVRHKNLPHYRQPLRLVDSVLLHIPFIGRLFASRLFVVARKK
jgi:2-polyprenyl-3-methyl-5-hydroxy-6-metoxy-1,4-benzoquinol methylase